jgi:hypothetical protein
MLMPACVTSGRGYELVADVPIVLKVLIPASRAIIFQQIDPAVPHQSRTAMCVVARHRRVVGVRSACIHRERENGRESDRDSKTLHLTLLSATVKP